MNESQSSDEKEIRHEYESTSVRESLKNHYDIITSSRSSTMGAITLLTFSIIAIFSNWIVPHDPNEIQRDDQGAVERMSSPSSEYLMGTTDMGRDIFSTLVVSAQVSLLVGVLAAIIAVSIGTAIGITSAYYGGWVDDLLMRMTDIIYAMPFIPFIFLLVLFLGTSVWNIVIAIALILWRSTARVVRSQTLSIKQRPYIESAQAAGTSDFRIMYRHILPNVAPLVFLYGAIATAGAILAEAGIAFLGFGDPTQPSWGTMIHNVYQAGAIRQAPLWVLAPGGAISMVVISVFLISRTYEKVANPALEDKYQQ